MNKSTFDWSVFFIILLWRVSIAQLYVEIKCQYQCYEQRILVDKRLKNSKQSIFPSKGKPMSIRSQSNKYIKYLYKQILWGRKKLCFVIIDEFLPSKSRRVIMETGRNDILRRRASDKTRAHTPIYSRVCVHVDMVCMYTNNMYVYGGQTLTVAVYVHAYYH